MSPVEPPMAPPPGFADRVTDAWSAERRGRRRRRVAALVLAASALLAVGLSQVIRPVPVELSLEVRADRPALPAAGGEATVMVTLSATGQGAAPVALAVVVDNGPSLTGDRLANVRRAVADLEAGMRPDDRLVLAADDAVLPSPDALRAVPAPCLGCAFDRALAALAAAPPTAQRTLVLITDAGLSRALRDKAAAAWRDHRVRTATIGVGGRFPPEAVNAVAASGHGHFYFAHNSSLIGALLAVELRAAREVALIDARLRVGQAVVELGRLGGDRRVLVPLTVSAEQVTAHVVVRLDGRAPDGASVALSRSVDWRISDDPERLAQRDPAVVVEQARRDAAHALVAALAAHEDGDDVAAAAALARGRAAFDRLPPAQRTGFETLADALRSLPEAPLEVATRHRAEASVLFEMQQGFDAAANQTHDEAGVFRAIELE